MRNKSNINLYLYTFLGLLFGLASLVDIPTMTSRAMALQEARAEAAVRAFGL